MRLDVVLSLAWLCACSGGKPNCGPASCPADQSCNASTGECEALQSCSSSQPCPSGQQCVSGVCSSCSTNVQCTTNFTTCDAQKQACAGCLSNDDCGSGLSVCAPQGCAQCLSDSDCSGATPHCSSGLCTECAHSTDCTGGLTCQNATICTHGCSADADCAAPKPYCLNGSSSSSQCVACLRELDCPTGQTCAGGACHPALPGDTCRNAIAVDLSSGSALLDVDLGRYGLSEGSVTQGGSAADAYFTVKVATEGFLSVDPNAGGPSFGVSMQFFLGDCTQRRGLASGAAIDHAYVVPGTYLLLVRQDWGFFETSSPFTMRLSVDPGRYPAGTTCLKPIDVPLAVPAEQVLAGATEGIYPASCSRLRPESTYQIDLSAPGYLELTATPSDPSVGLNVEQLGNCAAQSNCAYPTQPAHFGGRLDKGSYLFAVSSFTGDAGFTLDATTHPFVSNDRCETAEPVGFDDAGVFTVSTEPLYADPAADGGCGCGYSCAPGAVFRFSTIGMGAHSVRVDPIADGGTQWSKLSLESTCGGASPSLGCSSYDNPALDVTYLPEGEYYLHVGTANHTPIAAIATLGPPYPPPSNDSCASPQTLDLTSVSSASFSGDTRGAQDDFDDHGDCGGVSNARDVMYALALPSAKGHVKVTLTGTLPDFAPLADLSTSCTRGSPFTCASADAGSTAVVTATTPVTGLNLWIESFADAGSFTGTAQWAAPPANDTCATATSISAGQTVSGDTVWAFDDNGGSCGNDLGNDVFYAFTAPANGSYTATLTPTGFDAKLHVFDGCNGFTCNGDSNNVGVGAVESVTFTATRNVTYVIRVDALGVREGGPFTLTVQ